MPSGLTTRRPGGRQYADIIIDDDHLVLSAICWRWGNSHCHRKPRLGRSRFAWTSAQGGRYISSDFEKASVLQTLICTCACQAAIEEAHCEMRPLDTRTVHCLDRRIGDMATLERKVQAWVEERNTKRATIQWQFTKDSPRDKSRKFYPNLA